MKATDPLREHRRRTRQSPAPPKWLPGFQLPLLGSNQDSSDPESDVLPVTPRGKAQSRTFFRSRGVRNLAFHNNPINPRNHWSRSILPLATPSVLLGSDPQLNRRYSPQRAVANGLVSLALLGSVAACQGVQQSLGRDRQSARANADGLFDGLARRFDNVQRAPKFQVGRSKLGRHALSPSGVIGDTAVWTSSGTDSSRTLSLHGTHTSTGYIFTPRPAVPLPTTVGESRHIIRLKRRAESTYDWNTSVDHAIGTVRASDVAAATKALLAAPEQGRGTFVRGQHQLLFPQTTRVLSELFSLDTVRVTPQADGSSSVLVRFRMHPDRLKKTRPNFAKYLEKYVEPARYRVLIRDAQGSIWFDASGAENKFTVSYRSRDGQLLALSGPARPMPDTTQIAIDFSAKFMIFRVGVSRLVGEFVTVADDDERAWVMRFRREPEWHFPLAVNHLIRTALRHPFSGDGMGLRVGVRDGAAGAQSLIVREAALSVQEGAIVRWLGGLGSSAMSDFAGRAEAEENRYVYEVLSALRADFVGALAGVE